MPKDIPLSKTAMPEPLQRLLEKRSLGTLGALAALSAADLLKIDGVGEKGLFAIRKSLHYYGLGLAGDPKPYMPEFDALGLTEEEPSYPWDH